MAKYRPARSFKELINLVRAAEQQLIKCGHKDSDARIKILRGLYYGTTWSTDYLVEKSAVRNTAFNIYTDPTSPSSPPRPCLNRQLLNALRKSQDVRNGSRHTDFGHLIIGPDARQSYLARNTTIPTQGGTGLEISTWLGDLGGGAAMTALARVKRSKTRAVMRFRGTDFGGSINLEGDVAGFLVGRPKGTPTDPPKVAIPQNGIIADALAAYLEPSGAKRDGEWNARCKLFLSAIGGKFDASGNLVNRNQLIATLASKIEAFGCWYLTNRLRQKGRLNLRKLYLASMFLPGAARETASIFVDALIYCLKHPSAQIRARTNPKPSGIQQPPQSCIMMIYGMSAAKGVLKKIFP